jgi:glyoxylase-like metal-dependent hydrolase (beta-lactamase superfamily II)
VTEAPPTIDATSTRPPKQEQLPATTEVVEVASGVLRMQLPIEMPGLGHVNTYALVDEHGVALMDPGLPGPTSWDALVARLGEVGLRPRDVHTVFVTHSHVDHFGLAGRLSREGAPGLELVTHEAFGAHWRRGEGEDLILADVDMDDVDERDPYEGETPWGRTWRPPADIKRQEFHRHFERPTPTRYVRNGEPVRLAGREMFIVHSPGHTLDHICLNDPEEGVLFSGDHVLPSITPHISGIGSGRDPLDLFEESLAKVGGMTGVRLVLPAHGNPFTDLRGRTEAIRAHHVERLLRLRDLSQEMGPTTVEEFSHHLFRPDHWGPMAEAETFAHLEHLRLVGLAERRGSGEAMVYVLAAR